MWLNRLCRCQILWFFSKFHRNHFIRFDLTVMINFIVVFCDITFISQVAEVLSEMKTRISLTGWFHGPAISTPLPAKDPKLPVMTFIPASVFHITGWCALIHELLIQKACVCSQDGSVLSSWINPVYLSLSTQGEMQEQFVEDSEIKLNNFLLVRDSRVVNFCGNKSSSRFFGFRRRANWTKSTDLWSCWRSVGGGRCKDLRTSVIITSSSCNQSGISRVLGKILRQKRKLKKRSIFFKLSSTSFHLKKYFCIFPTRQVEWECLNISTIAHL